VYNFVTKLPISVCQTSRPIHVDCVGRNCVCTAVAVYGCSHGGHSLGLWNSVFHCNRSWVSTACNNDVTSVRTSGTMPGDRVSDTWQAIPWITGVTQYSSAPSSPHMPTCQTCARLHVWMTMSAWERGDFELSKHSRRRYHPIVSCVSRLRDVKFIYFLKIRTSFMYHTRQHLILSQLSWAHVRAWLRVWETQTENRDFNAVLV